jgi:hypothetical protein
MPLRSRRTFPGGSIALGALCALASCYVPPSTHVAPHKRIAEAETAIRQALAKESSIRVDTISQRAVGVFPFSIASNGADTTGMLSEAVGFGLADLLRSDLAKSRQLLLVDRLRLDALLREQRFAASGRVDTTTAPRAGKLVAARRILTGQLIANGNRLTVATQVTDIAQPARRTQLSGSAGLDAIFDAEKELAFRIFESLGITLTPAERAAVQQQPTKNLAAFLAYSRGVQLEARGRFGEAANEYRTAVRLDPGFRAAGEHVSEAQQLSGMAPGPTGGPGSGAAGSVTRAADAAVDRVNTVATTPAAGSQQSSTVVDPAFSAPIITIVVTIRPPT